MISRYGGAYFGTDNLVNSSSINWVLDAIRYPIFGNDQYPSFHEKGAILSWIINEGHVFNDGNKRTSNMCLLLFLRVNGFQLIASNDELVNVSILIATSKISNYSYKDYVQWLKERIVNK
jgi:death-on-curing protein